MLAARVSINGALLKLLGHRCPRLDPTLFVARLDVPYDLEALAKVSHPEVHLGEGVLELIIHGGIIDEGDRRPGVGVW
ncbi:hypothetical protein [Actinospongicola halichondriae]|uniref:hypothetical protein n=1 Tax=Actinospongicola halichondriae TaxID=3236844 RepID=UPI003D406A67